MNTQKLTAAKLWIVGTSPSGVTADSAADQPYLAAALFALRPFESRHVARITADTAWRLYVNTEWMEQASVAELGRELAHLTWHLLADHAVRAHAQGVTRETSECWRTASDLAIAETLSPAELVPSSLPGANEWRRSAGQPTETIYADRRRAGLDPDGPEDDRDQCGSAADGIRRIYELPPDTDVDGISRHRAEAIRFEVANEYRRLRGQRGDQYARIARWAAAVVEPTISWEPLLAAAIRRAVASAVGRGDFTYRRPSRRAAAMPQVVMPGRYRPAPQVAVVLDTSGSVDQRMHDRAMSELDRLLLSLGIGDSGVTVYSVDAAVHVAQRVRSSKDVVLVGSGGTDLRVGLDAAAQAIPRPEVIVVFTDGYTPWPAEPPRNASVIIALLAEGSAAPLPATPSWATRIECVDRDGGI